MTARHILSPIRSPHRFAVVAMLVLLAVSQMRAQSTAGQSQPAAKKDQCVVTGRVVALAGDTPLRKAHIRLQNNDDATRSVSVVTDAEGKFEIRSIDPGRYRLIVSRVGYVTQEYGQRKPQDPGAILALRPSQEMRDLVFRMTPGAVISGRILDEDGEALPGASVSAMRESYERGKRDLSPAISCPERLRSPTILGNFACTAWHQAGTSSAPSTAVGRGRKATLLLTRSNPRRRATRACITREHRIAAEPAQLRSRPARKSHR